MNYLTQNLTLYWETNIGEITVKHTFYKKQFFKEYLSRYRDTTSNSMKWTFDEM